MIEWQRISHEDIDGVWNDCSELIEKSCEYSGSKRDGNSYLAELTAGTKQLWLFYEDKVIKLLTITCLMQFPLKRVCSIEICTGSSLDNLIPNIYYIEKWAKEMGCEGMFLTCRPGFRRKLKDYKHTHDFLEKDL